MVVLKCPEPSDWDVIVIASLLVSVKYILPILEFVVSFSFLLIVKEVITEPTAEVCLNTGAELAVTLMYTVLVVVVLNVSVTLTWTGCAYVPSPLLSVLKSSVVGTLFNVTAPAVLTFTKSLV